MCKKEVVKLLNDIQKVTIQRFCELLFLNIILSVILTKWNIARSGDEEHIILMSLSIGVLIYLLINIKLLIYCYNYLKNKSDFIYVNYVAYGAFAGVNLITYILGDMELYTWLFAITKFARYSPFGISNIVSALIFHIVMVVMLFLVFVGMSIYKKKENVESNNIVTL